MGTIAYVDGFDDYTAADAALFGWSGTITSMVAGRVAGQAARITAETPSRSVPADTRYTIAFACTFANNASIVAELVQFKEGATIHGRFQYNGDGTFSIKNGAGTVLATSSYIDIVNDVPVHIEWDYTVHDSTGAYELRVNSIVVISPTGSTDTRNGGTNGEINTVRFATGSGQTVDLDDLILTKGGGFQGDCRVVTQRPDGDGANTDWTAVPYSIAYVAQNSTTGAAGASTIAWPTHKVDDVALLFVESAGGEAVTLTTPAGFEECDNSPQATGSGTAGTRIHAYWCRATSASMATPTIGDPGDHQVAAMLTFRGCVKQGSPINVTAGDVKGTGSTSFSAPSVTTTVDGCLVVAAISRDDDVATAEFSAWTNAGLASITEQFDAGTTVNNGGGLGIATGIRTTAGATGATTGTVVSSINASITIALAPSTGDFGCVADNFENGDDDYISSATATDRDTFTFPDVDVVGDVKAVVIQHVSRKDDTGDRLVAPSIRAGATDYDGTAVALSTSYAAYQAVYETDPDTAAAWDVADIDTYEFGVYLDT